MNIGFSTNNYKSMNCQNRCNTPQFGMALKFDESASGPIKRQVTKYSKDAFDKFFGKINVIIDRQKNNPVDIIVRKANHRDALVADVVDIGDDAIDNKTFSQRLLFKDGNLDFLDKSEKYADNLNEINKRIDDLPKYVEDVDNK